MDTNKSRWPTAAWWVDVLAVVEKIPLGLTKRLRQSIEQIGDWLAGQVGPSLSLYLTYLEEQGVSPHSWLSPFYDRWSKRHKLIYQSFSGGCAVSCG